LTSKLVSALIEQLDPAGCEVINLPDRVWVFGGKIREIANPAGSLRDCFWRKTLEPAFNRPWAKNLALPEDFDDWWAFSGYDDLLMFERDACFLARGTILFVESPGSIAELGCLASQDSILPRLMTVVQRRFHDEDARRSYLRLGPLDRVRKYGHQCVIGTSEPNSMPGDDFDAIVESVDAWLATPPRHMRFKAEEPAHRILFVADLCDLLLIVKLADLGELLQFFGVQLSLRTLEQYLELLAFFGFIRKEQRGREVFWMRAPDSDAPWISYKAADRESRFVRERFKIERADEHVRSDPRLKSVYGRHHVV
jgi:hypothetical protein